MNVAESQQASAYTNFNSFFTRALKPGARAVVNDMGDIACPVDGMVSEAGSITDGRLFQAKGHYYSLASLVGGSPSLTGLFSDGTFATLYLSPRDYHRIHMPLGGTLLEMCYIPGRLYSVNEASTHYIPGLFTRNERVVTLFDTDAGPMGMVLVGALFVSGIETVWAGNIARTSRGRFRNWNYRDEIEYPVRLRHGQEMGRFNMGSTVIVLFAAGRMSLDSAITAGNYISFGDRLGHYS